MIFTERFILRPFCLSDAQFLLDLNGNPEVLRYTGDIPFRNVQEARRFISNYSYSDSGCGRWLILTRPNGRRLGWCGLKYHPDREYYDIGYRIHRSEWGKGVATECAKACLTYAGKKGWNPVVGRTSPENLGSIRVLEKIGMNKIGEEWDTCMKGLIYLYN